MAVRLDYTHAFLNFARQLLVADESTHDPCDPGACLAGYYDVIM
jgi:hypothetical protein